MLKLLRGCSSKVGKNQFALDYINNINYKNFVHMFGNFNLIFNNSSGTIDRIRDCIKDLKDIKYNSIAEFEIRFFGVLYWKVFCKYELDVKECDKTIAKQLDILLYSDEKKKIILEM